MPLARSDRIDSGEIHGVDLLESAILGLDDEEEDDDHEGCAASSKYETVVVVDSISDETGALVMLARRTKFVALCRIINDGTRLTRRRSR